MRDCIASAVAGEIVADENVNGECIMIELRCHPGIGGSVEVRHWWLKIIFQRDMILIV